MPAKGEGFPVTCSAHRTNGEPCLAPPRKGQRTCRVHGGSTKAAIAKAEERLLMAADPAAATLVRLMRDKTVPPQVQLAAARDLLDRAGLSKTTQLQIALKPYEEDIESLLVDVGQEDDAPAIVPGEVLSTPDPPALSRPRRSQAFGPRKPRAYGD